MTTYIPCAILSLPRVAQELEIPEALLCEFVNRRLIVFLDGPGDYGVSADHPLNDPRRSKLSLEEAAFNYEIYKDCLRRGQGWGEFQARLGGCGWNGESHAQTVALDAVQRYCDAQNSLHGADVITDGEE